MADSHGRSITAGDSLVRRLQQLAWPPIDRALDDATGMRARMPHGRAETAVHGAVARRAKGPHGMTRRAGHGVAADSGVEANTHFFSSHLKDQCRLPCDAQNREQNRSGPVCTISM